MRILMVDNMQLRQYGNLKMGPGRKLVCGAIRNNYRLAKTLPKDTRVQQWEQYQQLTPEQQAVLRSSGWMCSASSGFNTSCSKARIDFGW